MTAVIIYAERLWDMNTKGMLKIIVVVLAMCITLSGCIFSDDAINQLTSKMLQKDIVERDGMLMMVVPFLVLDSTIDQLNGYITDPGSGGIVGGMIQQQLEGIDTATLSEGMYTFKIFDEVVRDTYLGAFNKRTEYNLSIANKANMESVMRAQYGKHPGLEQLLTESRITGGVIANVMRMFTESNEWIALFTDADTEIDEFKINHISQKMQTRIDNTPQISDPIGEMVSYMNTEYTAAERICLKNVLKEIGCYAPDGDVTPNPPGGLNPGGQSPGGQSPGGQVPDKPTVKDGLVITNITDSFECVSDYETYAAFYVQEIVDGKENKDVEMSAMHLFNVSELPHDNMALYYVAGSEFVPVKYNYVENGKLTAFITRAGHYVVSVQNSRFSDVSGWGQPYIDGLYYRGIVSGKTENEFYPDDTIKREEFVKLAVELFSGVDSSAETDFADVGRDMWFYKYVATAQKTGMTQGLGDGTFGAGSNITRQDICTMVYRTATICGIDFTAATGVKKPGDDAEIAEYAREAVRALYANGIVSGDSNGIFKPIDFATRQETAKIVYGVLRLYIDNTISHI